MRKLLILTAFLGLGMVVSCGTDKASASGDALTVTPDAPFHFDGEAFTFAVKAADGSDVTSQATIMVDDKPYTATSFYSLTPGTFTVKATYSGTTTKPVQIIVKDNPVALTSVVVTPSAADGYTGDVVTFTTAGDNNSNFTQACTYYVNGVAITGNSYTANTAGTIDVYAVYPGTPSVTSATVHLTIAQAVNFTKKVLIEDYTGAWCGWCPRVAYAIEQVTAKTTNAIPVAIHVSGGAQATDPFNTSLTQGLAQSNGVSSFPTARLNRKTLWTADEPSHLSQVTALATGTTRIGLGMSASLADSTATINVKVKFGQNFTGLKLVVYAVEDGLTADQHNYTTYYGGGALIKGFTYNDVLRASLTNVAGNVIDGNTNLNDEYTNSYTYKATKGVNPANLHFVAFVVDSTGKALNVRSVKNSETLDYEIQ